jgi:hypothetical protein
MSKLTKRQWLQNRKARENEHISLKNNSRVYCRQAKRNKFLYVSELKAKLALKYNAENGAERYYACNSCMGYHITSETIEEYMSKKNSYKVA